jgi:uncharacterized C2H2 Zn-finger protein
MSTSGESIDFGDEDIVAEEGGEQVELREQGERIFLVSESKLRELFQHCPRCGCLPRERKDQSKRARRNRTPRKARNLRLTVSGTSLQVGYYCSCNGGKNRII